MQPEAAAVGAGIPPFRFVSRLKICPLVIVVIVVIVVIADAG